MLRRPMAAMVRKDLRVARRSPLFPAITVLVALVFVGMYALLVQVSATTPIAVAKVGSGPWSDRLLEIVTTMRTIEGELFEIRATDAERAQEMFAEGEVGAVMEIPAGFDERVESGQAIAVPLRVYNINSDATKNYQLRVERAMRELGAEAPGVAPLISVDEHPAFAQDMRISVYLGTGLLMFAVVFSAMVNTGTLIAREWEERTAKLLMLSPAGQLPFVTAKWVGAGVQTVISLALVLLGVWLLLDYPVTHLGVRSWIALLALFAYGAALGALLGVALRRSLPIVPLCVVVAVTHLLVSGYESYIRGFAHGGAVEWLWWATHWWPMAPLTDQIRFEVSGLGPTGINWPALLWTLAVAAALTLLAVGMLRRQLVFAQGQ